MVEKVWEEEEEAGRQTKAGEVNIHGCSRCVVLQLVMNDRELSAGGGCLMEPNCIGPKIHERHMPRYYSSA